MKGGVEEGKIMSGGGKGCERRRREEGRMNGGERGIVVDSRVGLPYPSWGPPKQQDPLLPPPWRHGG